MQFTTFTAAAILAFATSSVHAVSSQAVINNCPESVWLTTVNSAKKTTGPFELKSMAAWASNVIGVGNSVGISKNDQFYSNETAKQVLGTSTDEGVLYWTISHRDGDPFEGQAWAVTSTGKMANSCQNDTMYQEKVHACKDQGVTLTLTLCRESDAVMGGE